MESVATQAAVEVALVMVASLFALLLVVHAIDWAKARSVKQPVRSDERIPAYEMELVGEDWRVHAAEYVRKQSRRSQIIQEVCSERH